jgi:dTMP kinase
MKKSGFLIAIEGIDGCGKSSLAQALAAELGKKNNDVLLTKEPGGTQLGKQLRELLHARKNMICDSAEYLLFAADRAQHFAEIIMPALRADKIIISDRMSDSSLAYQGYGRGIDRDMIARVNTWAMQGVQPDMIIYLRIDAQTALQRVMSRQETLTSFEQEKIDFWQRVIDGFEEIFATKKNVITLDGRLLREEILQDAIDMIGSYRK